MKLRVMPCNRPSLRSVGFLRSQVLLMPGSTHDSRIFTEGSVSGKLADGVYDGLLLGDSGYTWQAMADDALLSVISSRGRLRCVA